MNVHGAPDEPATPEEARRAYERLLAATSVQTVILWPKIPYWLSAGDIEGLEIRAGSLEQTGFA